MPGSRWADTNETGDRVSELKHVEAKRGGAAVRILVTWGDGVTAEIGETSAWRCTNDPALENFLNTRFRIRGVAPDKIAELAWRMPESIRSRATVELVDP